MTDQNKAAPAAAQAAGAGSREEIAQMICGFKLRQGKRTDTDKAWRAAMETAARNIALRAQPQAREDAQPVWIDGVPTKHHAKEWFIAETTFGDRAVLTALPEEYAYAFKTADETYIKADRIRRWMPFPDSQYLFPNPAPDAQRVGWLRAVDEEMVCAHLGVAEAGDSYETAKKKLASLIQWNIAVAMDPSVGGSPAPDALRVAVEALKTSRENIIGWFEAIDDEVRVEHEMHVSLKDDLDVIDQALAALQAEQGAK